MAIFVTADTHYHHEKAIEFCNRPFESTKHMNEEMIKRYNDVVCSTDMVYFLGDFCWGTKELSHKILSRLNGHKVLIKGNHDERPAKVKGWMEIVDYKRVKHEKQRFILSHYPMLSWHGMHRGSIMLHGHCHGSLRPELVQAIGAPLIDVGVDNWDYFPVNLDKIIGLVGFRKANKCYKGANVDQHISGNSMSTRRCSLCKHEFNCSHDTIHPCPQCDSLTNQEHTFTKCEDSLRAQLAAAEAQLTECQRERNEFTTRWSAAHSRALAAETERDAEKAVVAAALE